MRSGKASASAAATAAVVSAVVAPSACTRCRGLAVPVDASPLVWKPVVHELRRREQTGTAKILRVLEHEEEVHVADEDADELHDAAPRDDHVEREQHPRQIHGLKLRAEPEVDDDILVQLAPNI